MTSDIKTNIHKLIMKRGDICCKDDFDKNHIIEYIIDLYKKKHGNTEYLGWISNDILRVLGYKNDLTKSDKLLWESMNRSMMTKNKENLVKIKKVMSGLPLYYLFSIIGMNYPILELMKL